ncbi:hypothetical protein HII31_08001 [Pseudocercospora fuligena]|uniref:NTF2-like domain-containing protein n=1 Tax=Pseudocercospora fuligena TaxID=685502 RepID=A0A8H6VHN0_9PEZI|nr:hypothetical protein HII31_08001 [Pseudocercospora fuligena]
MLVPIFFALLLSSALTIAATRPTCLSDPEAQQIATQYLKLFATNSSGLIPTGTALPLSLLTEDYTEIDEDAVICGNPKVKNGACYFVGSTAPLFPNRATMVNSIKYVNDPPKGVKPFTFLYTDFQPRLLHAFASCDEIAIRFEGRAKSAKGERGVTVPEGTEVKWKGTQLIKVDLKTRRVKSGSSSEDRFNMFEQLGIKNIDDVLAE